MNIIENVMPILQVKNLKAAIEYYDKKIGFKFGWEDKSFAGVYRDGHCIMLQQTLDVIPQRIWIGLHEMDSLYNKFLKTKVEVIQHPTNNSWAYDMKIKDIDGNILWFGTEPKKG